MNELVRNIVIGCAVATVAVTTLSYVVNCRKKPEPDTLQKQDAPPEPVYTTATATVTDMACWVETVGIKQPKTVKRFQVVFETDGGEPVKLDVPEELYDAFEKGQTGTLTLVDGQLYGFLPTKEV